MCTLLIHYVMIPRITALPSHQFANIYFQVLAASIAHIMIAICQMILIEHLHFIFEGEVRLHLVRRRRLQRQLPEQPRLASNILTIEDPDDLGVGRVMICGHEKCCHIPHAFLILMISRPAAAA